MSDGFGLDAYLTRVGGTRTLAPGLEGLAVLHRAHCAAIPFENLDILLGRSIALDLLSLQAKLVRDRRGGYCFEQNTLFKAALEALGYRVTALAARVRVGTTEVRPRTHMLLRVDLPEGTFVNHFTSTHPRSAFVLNLAAQRSWPERRALLRNRDLVVRENGSSTPTTVRDPDHLLEILDSVFGLAFPTGTRFARPEF